MRKWIVLALSVMVVWGLEVGQMAPRVVLDGKSGGRVDGKPFDSADLKGKVIFLVYSDPDKRGLNEELFQKLKERHFDREHYGSVAVINMAATWMPNFVLSAILKKKQKEFPDTLYVKDKQKVLVKEWGLADQDQNIVVLDKDGRVLFVDHGKLDAQKIDQVIQTIQEHL
ncbi:MAG: transcriptional regulator [Epsilonproteobacteria bacterium]|nr:transcriptional regulator [Campylobacterota bacterium]NPA65177.1 transcriptional regulator [Campylobacterota bacterium]